MQPELENSLLHLIIEDWRALALTARPWGMWVRAYTTIGTEQNQLDMRLPPYRVWFLDHTGLHERTYWDWERFRVVQLEQPWCQRGFANEPVGVFGRRHEIGLAGFAPYGVEGEAYLEAMWGGLFGQGWRITFQSDGTIKERHTIWIS